MSRNGIEVDPLLYGYLVGNAMTPNFRAINAERQAHQANLEAIRLAAEAQHNAELARQAQQRLRRLADWADWAELELMLLGSPDTSGLDVYIRHRVLGLKTKLLEDKVDTELTVELRRKVNLRLIAMAEYLSRWVYFTHDFAGDWASEMERKTVEIADDATLSGFEVKEILNVIVSDLRELKAAAYWSDQDEWLKARLGALVRQADYSSPSETVPTAQSVGNLFERESDEVVYNVLYANPGGFLEFLL